MGTTTYTDYMALINRVVSDSHTFCEPGSKVIVCSNHIWQYINATSVFDSACPQKQPTLIFMAAHYSTDPSINISLWRSLATVNSGSSALGPDLFLFTKGA